MESMFALTLATGLSRGKLSKPFELLRTGSFKHPKHGEFEVTSDGLDRAVENFNAWAERGADVPIDYDHSYAAGEGSKAAGWLRSVARKGDSLVGQVEWTPQAASAIRDGEYRFFSSEFDTNWKNETGDEEGFTLLAGGLTNRPFLKGMKPVTLTDDARAELIDDLEERATWLDCEVTDSEAEIRDVTPKPDDKKVTLSEERFAALEASETQVVTLTEENKTLTEEVKSLKGELSEQTFKTDMGQARREGRVDLKDETTSKWQSRYEEFGAEKARELLFEMPAETIPVTASGASGERDEIEVPEGPMGERFALHERAMQIAKEKDIDYVDAVRLADAEVAK